MSKSEGEQSNALEARAKRVFDVGVEGLDAHTRSKLAQARARAVELVSASSGVRARHAGGLAWVPAGVAALAVVATALMVWRSYDAPDAVLATLAFDDFEIVLGEDELEMLEELEFYAWLQEQLELESPSPTDDVIG